MTSRLSEFAAGYYAIDLRPTPYEDGPAVDTALYRYLTDTVYGNTDTPVWMRVDLDQSPYFKLTQGEPMPHDVIGLPSEWMQDFDLDDDNRVRPMFVCKPGHAHYLEQSALFGGWAGADEAGGDHA